MKKTLIVAAVSASFATAASAQSSVTLYGIVDAGFACTGSDCLDTGLQLRRPLSWWLRDGLHGVT
jgi:predicted porin